MLDLISKALFLIAEIGVIIVMVIIIFKERGKRKKNENKMRRNGKASAVPNQHTLYLD